MPELKYAEVVVNVKASLQGTFHYHMPADLRPNLKLGSLVEVEFGRQLAQAIVVGFSAAAPVEETKPVINLIDPDPIVWPWQIDWARWMSDHYQAPLITCLRLLLPPGLSRWADMTVDINPWWDGIGRLTEDQEKVLAVLKKKGDQRGRQLRRALPGVDWKKAVTQLAKRDIVRKASVLDPPRARRRTIRTAQINADWATVTEKAIQLGRRNRRAAILHNLVTSADPLPPLDEVMVETGANKKNIKALVEDGFIRIEPQSTLLVRTAGDGVSEDEEWLRPLPSTLESYPFPDEIETLQKKGLVEMVIDPAVVSLSIPPETAVAQLMNIQQAGKYYRVLRLLTEAALPVPVSEVYAETGASINHLRRLDELGLIQVASEKIWRDSLADRDFTPVEAPQLIMDQARVWGRIKVGMLTASEEAGSLGIWDAANESKETINNGPYLLHGVTGSGKTEIYMRAIELALDQGKQAIVLVPEIALTPQTVRRFAARFPGRVAILHSRLSDGERYDTWRRARLGLFDIVIGPRSALFTPFPELGVIVIDEEHDDSYKQTPPIPPPYYHARDAAIELGRLTGATVIMGSATPDVVTYHRAKSGRYQLLEMPRRIMGHRRRIDEQAARHDIESRYQSLPAESMAQPSDLAVTIPLPPVQIVDLRQELRSGNRSIFSRALQEAVTETLSRGEQCILFLNRRGTASFVICRTCGHKMTCPRCGMPLTYHRPHLALVCHQCGRREPNPPNCPQCGSDKIRYFGLGTERVEELVQQRWPAARIVRWDRDTTTGPDSHEALLDAFVNRKADILIGTQMIAKGLDLPFVTLVGVISADVALSLPDYRTGERAFQHLSQVAGRAGRGLLGGRVIMQTYQPEHYAIRAAADHDYAGFYVDEIRFRTQHNLPPFRRMARLLLTDPINERARRGAEILAQGLRMAAREASLGVTEILGPVPPFFSRIDGRYRWHIIVRSPDPNLLLEAYDIPSSWYIDIDPLSTL